MKSYDFVHLSVFAFGGEVRGKTKLQKLVYFLGQLTGNLDELGYRPHFYGPYSAEVAGAVDRLRALGFLDEFIAGGGAYDERGFEVARHDFRLNESGRKLAEVKAAENPDVFKRLTSAAEVLRRTGEQDYMKLSIAAKTYFMLGERNSRATIDELSQLASRFGWSVNPDEVKESANFLVDIGLVKLSKPL